MASAFSDSLMVSGGITMKFLPDFGTHMEAHNQKKIFDVPGLVCTLQTEIPKIPFFGNATSKHANFTKFSRIVTIDVRNRL